MDLHTLLSSFSYGAVFVLMVANGAINFPSSQFLYIIAGVLVGSGHLAFTPTIIAGALGNTIGNIIAFLLVKKYEHPFARKILMLDEATFSKIHSALHETFSRRGMIWIFLGKLTPSVKAFIPVVAGLANTKTKLTSFIFLIASFIWATALVTIGKYFGEHVTFKSLSVVSLAIGAGIAFVVYKNLKKKGVL